MILWLRLLQLYPFSDSSFTSHLCIVQLISHAWPDPMCPRNWKKVLIEKVVYYILVLGRWHRYNPRPNDMLQMQPLQHLPRAKDQDNLIYVHLPRHQTQQFNELIKSQLWKLRTMDASRGILFCGSTLRWGEMRWGEVRWGGSEVMWGDVITILLEGRIEWGEVRWGKVR